MSIISVIIVCLGWYRVASRRRQRRLMRGDTVEQNANLGLVMHISWCAPRSLVRRQNDRSFWRVDTGDVSENNVGPQINELRRDDL